MTAISIASALSLTRWSERTLWRRLADGTLQRAALPSDKVGVLLESLLPHCALHFSAEDQALLQAADAGDATAQIDVAVLCLSQQQADYAPYWLELAAKQNAADAMHWLATCYAHGWGVTQDDNLALMWLAKAAAAGHFLAQQQMAAIKAHCLGPHGAPSDFR